MKDSNLWSAASVEMWANNELKTAYEVNAEDENETVDKQDPGFMYDWEVAVDSMITLENGEKSGVLYSRVYIDDSDLVNMGADDVKEIAQKVGALKVDENRKLSNYMKKLCKLGYVPGFNATGCASSLNSNVYKSENFVDVDFKEYKSSFGKVLANYSLQQICSGSSLSPSAGSPVSDAFSQNLQDSTETFRDEVNSRSSSSSSIGTKTPQVCDSPEKLTMPFDFGFDAKRDAKLVAKDAKKVMGNDKEVMKYWFQRYRLFSRLNEGILMDKESWFSVTPEKLAEHIAERMVQSSGIVILDAFTGAGGNAIQFAKRGAFVYAVDLDPVKLRCAQRNAQIYGVAHQISFICADFFHVAKVLQSARENAVVKQAGDSGDFVTKEDEQSTATTSPNNLWWMSGRLRPIDAVFLSPPWGGPAYLQSRGFDLDEHMEPTRGSEIYRVAKEISPNICYFLPRNTILVKLMLLDSKVEMEQAVLNGKVKTICAYFGKLIASD